MPPRLSRKPLSSPCGEAPSLLSPFSSVLYKPKMGEDDAAAAATPTKPILTAPAMLEADSATDHKTPGLVPRILTLFKSVRPGSDLTKFQLPPIFNMPKSQLQSYGECIYCIGQDLMGKCVEGNNTLERFTAVVAWCISTTRPVMFGMAPFNPILGETHHVSRGDLNVLLEQGRRLLH